MTLNIEFHALHTVPPSCINRDDTGTPKTATYGGVVRSRVSSQAWKSAIRKHLRDSGYPGATGIRTRDVLGHITKHVTPDLDPAAVAGVARLLLDKAGIKVAKGKAAAIAFLSDAQLAAVARVASNLVQTHPEIVDAATALDAATIAHAEAVKAHGDAERVEARAKAAEANVDKSDKDAVKEAKAALAEAKKSTREANAAQKAAEAEAKAAAASVQDIFKRAENVPSAADTLGSAHSFDLALFGRMFASAHALDVDASAQVAHALAVHETQLEGDYYVAVTDDDEVDAEDAHAGASMIGNQDFTSATLYRYATVNFDQLTANLDNDKENAARAVALFAEAFITSMPTGKQNSFANATLPEFVVVTVRDSQPVNMVGAFEAPVDTTDEGYRTTAARRLVDEINAFEGAYVNAPTHRFVIATSSALAAVADELPDPSAKTNLPSLIESLTKVLGGEQA